RECADSPHSRPQGHGGAGREEGGGARERMRPGGPRPRRYRITLVLRPAAGNFELSIHPTPCVWLRGGAGVYPCDGMALYQLSYGASRHRRDSNPQPPAVQAITIALRPAPETRRANGGHAMCRSAALFPLSYRPARWWTWRE